MNPFNPLQPFYIRPSVRVEHEPGLPVPVVDQDGIGGAVVDRVAEEGLVGGDGRPTGLGGEARGRQQQQDEQGPET
ncbi:MAG: hypothetical protein P8177_06805 [Gemmatimonadota bacterium]